MEADRECTTAAEAVLSAFACRGSCLGHGEEMLMEEVFAAIEYCCGIASAAAAAVLPLVEGMLGVQIQEAEECM